MPSLEEPRSVRLPALLLAVAILIAYAGSMTGEFVFDDIQSITNNPTLHHFSSALSPPRGGLTVSGRPLLNLSFAINDAISGTQAWSYHALNLIIHGCAALTLMGVVRRTPPRSTKFAFAVALLWAVHPLQTESVTYTVQRAESLMGLFYLLTLYCFIRGAENPAVSRWLRLSWVACLLGMATKEVMVTAPVIVLLYDRTFVSGSFPEAWKRRRGFYMGLGGTWLLMAYLVASTSGRGGTAGFGAGVPWWAYGITQFRAIAHYLRLSVWPSPLIFDYGSIVGGKTIEVVFDAAVVVSLATISTVLCARRKPLGFLGVACFLILLPSSSVVPVATETISEHRMYLSLAAVLAATVGGCSTLVWHLFPALGPTPRKRAIIGLAVWVAIAAIWGIGTIRRNASYRSGRALWSDTVRKLPTNARAHSNLGIVLAEDGDPAGAEVQFRAALALAPDFATVHVNLGNVLLKQGRLPEAVANYRTALRFLAQDPDVHEDLGTALLRLGQVEEARGEFTEALRLDPNSSKGHFDMGSALDRQGRFSDAAAQYREALRLLPDYSDAWYNLANLLVRGGQLSEAADAYASTVRLRPDFADGHVNFGNVLVQLNRKSEAIREFQAALRLQPDAADIRASLGELLAGTSH